MMDQLFRRALFLVSAIGLAAMVGALFLQVVAREFNWPVDWTEEAGRFSFISMVFIAAAYGTLTRAHLRVSVFADVFARKYGPRPLQFVHTVILIGFAGVMVYFSAINFIDGIRYPNISPALRFNQNTLFVAMCAGFLLIGLLHLRDLITLIKGGTLDD